MDNRINVKDIVLILLLLLVGLGVVLGIVQKQRQWDKLEAALAIMGEQREAVDGYKRELSQLRRDNDDLRAGVEQMTASVQSLVEVLTQRAESGDQGPTLGEGTDGIGGIGDISFGSDEDDETFYRVAGLRDRDDFAEGDFFIDAFAATVKSLTPFVAGDVYADRIDDYVMQTLLGMDPITLEYTPLIASSWVVSEDGLTFTFSLRKDVVFSDGKPLTAGDVAFTYNWIMNPKVNAPRLRAYYEKFESVIALDDHTVEFTFREPYFAALGLCGSLDILAEHYYKQFTEDQYNQLPGLLFGSGPYKMKMDPKLWEPGSQKIELVRNDNYWGPRPALDRVIWREILEDTARLAEFRNREVDRFSMPASMYRTLSTDEQLRAQADLYEYEYVSSGYLYVGWNQKKNGRDTAFSDKRVRQAMTLLIDRSAICSRVYDNLATPATGPFHPLGWQADPEIEPWPYDPARAVKLLEAAGYKDRDGNGVRESTNGVPLSFEFIYSTGSTEAEQMALMMQEAMRQAGVEMRLDPLDWPLMQQKLDDRGFDAIMLGWGGSVESDVFQMFHSTQIADGGDNYVSHVSPALDTLIDQARTTVDRELDTDLWNRVHAQLHEDQPYTFLINRKAILYMDKRLRNIEITNIGTNFGWEYYVPVSEQLHNAR